MKRMLSPFKFGLLLLLTIGIGSLGTFASSPTLDVNEKVQRIWGAQQGAVNSSAQAGEELKEKFQAAGLFDETEMVPMRDGTKLSTTIFKLPFSSDSPVILVRTPYDKEEIKQIGLLLSLMGYVVVTQDTRGRFASEGEDRVFQDDGWGENQDGYDTIEWIAQQSWCNGKIGTWGYSAYGIATSAAAAAVPPSLDCQVLGYTPSNGYDHVAYQSGVFRKSLVNNWLVGNNSGHYLPEFLAHPIYDDFWVSYDMTSRHSLMNVPCLFIGGFYDCFSQGTLDDFVGRQTNGAEGAAGNQWLLMGPWTHANEMEAEQGQLNYPANSVNSNIIADTLAWFDYWLKGEENGTGDQPHVQYYVMGDVSDPNAAGNEWRTDELWPPQSTPVAFYLQPGGLTLNSPQTEDVGLLNSDQENPVPTLGGMNLEIDSGPYNQATLLQRNDVLVYSTEPLEQPLEVTGRVRAVIYAESNLTDNDITVRLCDVYPDGRSMLVCDGVARASFRDSMTNPTSIQPGEIVRYEVDLWSTSIAFNAGHQIQIIVANTNYPRFELNPAYLETTLKPLSTVHLSPDYPSHLLLPVTSELPVTNVSNWSLY